MGQYSKRLKNKLNNIISEMAADPSPWTKNPETDFTRSRKITFTDLVRILLTSCGNSLNKELYDYFKPAHIAVTASAFVQQRDKLLPDALEYLLHKFNAVCRDTKLYNGYRLFAVDGSTMTYNGSPGEDTFMPKSGANGVNQYHVNAMYDLLNKTYADIIVQPKPRANEPKAAWQMMERLPLVNKAIMMADRGYGGVNLIEHINRIPNAYYLVRIKNNLWKEIRDLPLTDLDMDITIHLRTTQTNADKEAYAGGDAKWVAGHGKYRKLSKVTWDFESPYSVSVRIVRFKISENTWETIATSLPKNEFPPMVLKYLYHLRWGIETSFRELKYAIGVTNFHAKKGQSVLQEIFAKVVMYNFCERITMNVTVDNDKSSKWQYQINYTMGIHICRDFFRLAGEDAFGPEEKLSHYILPIRPNRADRRKVTPKPAASFLYRIA